MHHNPGTCAVVDVIYWETQMVTPAWLARRFSTNSTADLPGGWIPKRGTVTCTLSTSPGKPRRRANTELNGRNGIITDINSDGKNGTGGRISVQHSVHTRRCSLACASRIEGNHGTNGSARGLRVWRTVLIER